MLTQFKPGNAVGFVRVSSPKQGFDGDSPEAQKHLIRRMASSQGLRLKKTFTFFESASKEVQPVLKLMGYLSDPKNKIEFLLVKSIDRLTRLGPGFYLYLTSQLDLLGIQIVDSSGIISPIKINTLEHLDFSYKWSVYRPTKNAEIIEAERGSDEIRDICTRTISSEIRFTQQGYWMRRPPCGFTSKRFDTAHGKRSILVRLPKEAYFIEKMFELRNTTVLNIQQIVDEINELGFKTRIFYIRSKQDTMRVIGRRGGGPLTVKAFYRYIQNPIYAGIICEKWTKGQPVRGKFKGLVSFDTFNRANRGKIVLSEQDGQIIIQRSAHQRRVLVSRGVKSGNYPYRKVVVCPFCELSLCGSASRGKSGKYYPAYHCARKHGHYFRVPKAKLESAIEAFVKNVRLSPDHTEELMETVRLEWDRRRQAKLNDAEALKDNILELEDQAKVLARNIAFTSSPTQASYAERELVELDKQIQSYKAKLPQNDEFGELDEDKTRRYVRHFGGHIGELVFSQKDPHGKAASFALFFDSAPTYPELEDSTADGSLADVFTCH